MTGRRLDGQAPGPGHGPPATAAWRSAPALLALHAVRVTGVADDVAIARRTGLDQPVVTDLLLDAEAFGWVTLVRVADTGGWTLTERGRAHDERQLADELRAAGARAVVEAAHEAFELLNARLVAACTDWQLRPAAGDRLAVNDHTDLLWDARVLGELGALEAQLTPLVGDLRRALTRFGGYDEGFSAALARARAGQRAWVTGVGVASCHTVWMQLHEDLLSTLGLARDSAARRR